MGSNKLRLDVGSRAFPCCKGVWVSLSAIAIGGEGIALYLHHHGRGESLLASFKIEETIPQQMNIDYTMRSFGKQSALVSAIGLLEIVGLGQRDDPLHFCDEVSGHDLAVIQIGQNMMGAIAKWATLHLINHCICEQWLPSK
jgi:hypothetical protein